MKGVGGELQVWRVWGKSRASRSTCRCEGCGERVWKIWRVWGELQGDIVRLVCWLSRTGTSGGN